MWPRLKKQKNWTDEQRFQEELGVAGSSDLKAVVLATVKMSKAVSKGLKERMLTRSAQSVPGSQVQTANGQTVPPELRSVATGPSSRSDLEKACGNRKIDQWLIEFRDQKIN